VLLLAVICAVTPDMASPLCVFGAECPSD
jgi:hypothetical protein